RPGVFGGVEGENTLVVYDVAGNTTTFVFTLDTVSPTVPVITTPISEQVFETAPILNQWSASADAGSGVAKYQIAYQYDDNHTFSSSTCPNVEIDGEWVGCRDVNGTSRNHTPGLSEQGGVTIWVRAFDNAGNVSEW